METKFKTGDKVRVLPHASCVSGISPGDVVVVDKIWINKTGFDDTLGNDWYNHEVDLVTTNSFTKSDLKDWMVVKVRNGYCGDYYTVNLSNNLLLDADGYTKLSNYNEDLLCANSDWDIMKVYAPGNMTTLGEGPKPGELIWERVEKTPHLLEIEAIQKALEEGAAKQKELSERLEQLKGS